MYYRHTCKNIHGHAHCKNNSTNILRLKFISSLFHSCRKLFRHWKLLNISSWGNLSLLRCSVSTFSFSTCSFRKFFFSFLYMYIVYVLLACTIHMCIFSCTSINDCTDFMYMYVQCIYTCTGTCT